MTELAELLEQTANTARGESSMCSTIDLTELKVSAFNGGMGQDGDCPVCRGKGLVAFNQDGEFAVRECACMTRKRCLARVRRSGLGELYDRYTLAAFTTGRPWQEKIKRRALEYIGGGAGWFFVCGRSGSGKTHITAAIARELMEKGMETRYFMWRQDAPRLKALVNERAEYARIMGDYTDCAVLLIDDLWKGAVTEADISLTFELLNARYNMPSKLTLISSEWTAEKILQRDEAIGGRICERARGFILQTADVNLRLAGDA